MNAASQIGDLLAEAFAAWGFSEADVAAKSGLDIAAVREALRGEADVSDLDAVVRAVGGDLDDLMGGRRFWVAPVVAFKSAPSEFEAPLVRAALLRVACAARDRAVLTELLSLPDPVRAGRERFAPVAPLNDVTAQAESLAREVRAHLGIENEPILSLREVMGRLGVWTFITNFGVSTVDGMVWRDETGRACVCANVQARGGLLSALRMTFAHDLCHALFDGTRSVAYGLVEHRSDRGEALERRANAFAAHLLAPRAAVQRFLADRGLSELAKPTAADVRALSEHFLIGVEAMANHLVSCNRWSREDLPRSSHLKTRAMSGPDNIECNPTEAEACVPMERRGAVLTLATTALERGAISLGRWREVLELNAWDEWQILLDEQRPSRDVEHRSER